LYSLLVLHVAPIFGGPFDFATSEVAPLRVTRWGSVVLRSGFEFHKKLDDELADRWYRSFDLREEK